MIFLCVFPGVTKGKASDAGSELCMLVTSSIIVELTDNINSRWKIGAPKYISPAEEKKFHSELTSVFHESIKVPFYGSMENVGHPRPDGLHSANMLPRNRPAILAIVCNVFIFTQI